MAGPTQFRHYLIAQDAGGSNIEVVRSAEQVGVLAFDAQRLVFVHFHVLLEPLKNRKAFDERASALQRHGHPRLARLLDWGEDEGSPFYITANIDGETLRNYLERMESLPVWLAMSLAGSALESVLALLPAGDYVSVAPLEGFRIVQTSSRTLEVLAADFRITEESAAKTVKSRLSRAPFEKQAQFLLAFFQERLDAGGSGAENVLTTSDFTELLQNLLGSCGPEKEREIVSLVNDLAALAPRLPGEEVDPAHKPKAFLAPQLADAAAMAQALNGNFKILSQKMDAGHPYALHGSLAKSGQQVLLEQVPPPRLVGPLPIELIRHVQNLPKAGKFPNLVPVVSLEESHGITCTVETAVEGASLQDVLDARGTLGVQEIYLLLGGVDASLAQLEKAGAATRTIRLEDIFLFTGFDRESPHDSGLLTQKLQDWPGFSVVIRAHPCLHSMAGRGTDPALLLPINPAPVEGVEPLWNGGWMAALGCHLAGMPDGDASRHETGIAETDSVLRLLHSEVQRACKGTPVTRASFLSRFARVLQQYNVAQMSSGGGFQNELSGSPAAAVAASTPAPETPLPQAQTQHLVQPQRESQAPTQPQPQSSPQRPAAEKKKAPMPAVSRPPTTPPKPTIGFAEALIRQPQIGSQSEPRSSHAPADSGLPSGLMEDEESSWKPMHEEAPFVVKVMLALLGSIVLGALLAHLSGRALWQEIFTPQPVAVESPTPRKNGPVADLSVPTPPKVTTGDATRPANPGPKSPVALPPPTGTVLSQVNGDDGAAKPRIFSPAGSVAPPAPKPPPGASVPAVPAPPAVSSIIPLPPPVIKPPAPNSTTESSAVTIITPPSPATVPSPSPGAETTLDARLRELRKAGGKLPASLKAPTEKAASEGNTESMLALGRASLRGDLGPADARTAFVWFEKAAQKGDAAATVALAECHLNGQGTPQDFTKAAALLSGAAAAGDAAAKNLLGACYAYGKGVERDDARAFELCSQAHQAGIAAACGNLGALYLRGQGVVQNPERAVELFAEGAHRGHTDSMFLFAQSLEYGTGIPADRPQATLWYQQAARQGNAEAAAWCREKGIKF